MDVNFDDCRGLLSVDVVVVVHDNRYRVLRAGCMEARGAHTIAGRGMWPREDDGDVLEEVGGAEETDGSTAKDFLAREGAAKEDDTVVVVVPFNPAVPKKRAGALEEWEGPYTGLRARKA